MLQEDSKIIYIIRLNMTIWLKRIICNNKKKQFFTFTFY